MNLSVLYLSLFAVTTVLAAPLAAQAQRKWERKVWGVQVAPGARSTQDMHAYLSSLATFAAYGNNTLCTFVPVEDAEGRKTFSSDGKKIQPDTGERLEKMLDLTRERRLHVVLGLFDDDPTTPLKDMDAYEAAAKAIAGRVPTDRRHQGIILLISRAKLSPEWQRGGGFPLNHPDTQSELAKAVHEARPDLHVAVGCESPDALEQLAQDPDADILVVEDYETLVAALKLQEQGIEKPIFDLSVRGNGGWYVTADGKPLQGVWRKTPDETNEEIQAIESAIQRSKQDRLYHFIPSFPSWTRGSHRGPDFRDHFEMGGMGTPDDPGIGWYLRMVDAAQRPAHEIQSVRDGLDIDGSWMTAEERQQGFAAMFDGESLKGWAVLGRPWEVRDGLLIGPKESGSWVRSWKRYGDFVLRLEVCLEPGVNSGIFIRSPYHGRQSMTGFEIQLLGRNEDPKPNGCGSVYTVKAPRVDAFKKPGEWNELEIDYRGRHVKMTVNGKVIHDVDFEGQTRPGTRTLEGFIGLQAHGHGSASFRRMRIREL